MVTKWEDWGRLADRYKTPRPRRMLALDGGGIRGILALQVLVEIEDRLKAHYKAGDGFRLSQFFDYVAGTSTGAILAAGLARGMTARELLTFYESFGKDVFAKRPWYERWKSLYGDGALQKKLKEVFGAKTDLTPAGLETLLLVVTRNTTTDSAWPVSSNPAAKYNALDREDCNLRLPLWELVRASTAAPVFFPPEVVKLGPREYVFVDGGTTSYNNPAFILYRMATSPAYRLEWPSGEERLLLVSLGTGSAPVTGTDADDPERNIASNAVGTLSALMSQAAFDQDLACRTVGRCVFGRKLDREVEDLVPKDAGGVPIPLSERLGRAFLYARYDVELTDEGMKELGIAGIDPTALRKLDSIDHIDGLVRVGQALAKKFKLEHLGGFPGTPLVPRPRP